MIPTLDYSNLRWFWGVKDFSRGYHFDMVAIARESKFKADPGDVIELLQSHDKIGIEKVFSSWLV